MVTVNQKGGEDVNKRNIIIDQDMIDNLSKQEMKSLEEIISTYKNCYQFIILSRISMDSYDKTSTSDYDNDCARYLVSINDTSCIKLPYWHPVGTFTVTRGEKITFGFELDNNCNIMKNTYMVISHYKDFLDMFEGDFKVVYNDPENKLYYKNVINYCNEERYIINKIDQIKEIIKFTLSI